MVDVCDIMTNHLLIGQVVLWVHPIINLKQNLFTSLSNWNMKYKGSCSSGEEKEGEGGFIGIAKLPDPHVDYRFTRIS